MPREVAAHSCRQHARDTMPIRNWICRGSLCALTILIAACSGGTPSPAVQSGRTSAPTAAVSLDKNAYPVFPDADAGADPSVSAEQGGKGFTGEGWQTNTSYELIGDPR